MVSTYTFLSDSNFRLLTSFHHKRITSERFNSWILRQELILWQRCFVNGVTLTWPWLSPVCLCIVCSTLSRNCHFYLNNPRTYSVKYIVKWKHHSWTEFGKVQFIFLGLRDICFPSRRREVRKHQAVFRNSNVLIYLHSWGAGFESQLCCGPLWKWST